MRKKKSDLKKAEARDLVYKAYETTVEQGRKLVKKALKLDPDNSDAYTYLGNTEEDISIAIEHYKNGMEAGRKTIGEKDFEEMKGHFWGFHETRPFMRAKACYAECLYAIEKHEESIKQFSEMLVLNPNDNQGVRYRFAIILIIHNQFSAYEKLREQFNEDGSTMWLFTYAVYVFKKEGDSANATKALLKANKANSHVIPYLIGAVEIPPNDPQSYIVGHEDEALVYLNEAAVLWLETDNAIEWANSFYVKRN